MKFYKKNEDLINYKRNDTIATGMERPKTTALFFDKIWIPSNYRYSEYGKRLEYNKIPIEVLIREKNEELNCGLKYDMLFIHRNRPYDTVEEDVFGKATGYEFLFSYNRNFGLKKVVHSFKKIYGIEITPIFINKTKFEESILSFDKNELAVQMEIYKYSQEMNKLVGIDVHPVPNINLYRNEEVCNAYEICINYVPTIIEERLTWEQVLNIRKDRGSKNKLKRFKYWTNTSLKDKSKAEIIETLEKTVDDYKFALKKHGILTSIGGFTTILSSSSTILEVIINDFSGALVASISVTAAIVSFTATQLMDYIQTKREPVAFIYDVSKKY
jgi:hypothetical protein